MLGSLMERCDPDPDGQGQEIITRLLGAAKRFAQDLGDGVKKRLLVYVLWCFSVQKAKPLCELEIAELLDVINLLGMMISMYIELQTA